MLMVSISNFSTDDESKKEIYLERMRELIREVRNNTDPNRILITQNGNRLYFKGNKLDENFMKVTNGTTQESLYYGYDFKLTNPTPKDEKEYLLSLLNPIRKAGKPVFGINYGKGTKAREFLKKENVKTNFVNELIPVYEATDGYVPIENFNSNDINSLNDVKTFLLLLNPEKFKNVDDYYNYLKNTDYDLLIIEVSHNEKYMSKSQIEALKTKKNGGKRIVIAYFSIGEAGNYRNYWKKEWKTKRPSWIVEENKNWPGDYMVKYWSPEWKAIVKEYQKMLDNMGVDGYLLDTVDTYYYFEEKFEKTKKIIN